MTAGRAHRRRGGGRRGRRPLLGADRRRGGRAGGDGLAEAALARARATGRRAGSRPRSAPTTRPSCTSRTPSRPGGEPVVDRPPSCWRGRRPASSGSSSDAGSSFDLLPDESLSLALEGGHSRRRVVHAGGAATGRRITERLAELAARDERIDVIERTSAVALWSDGGRCHGVITDAGRLQAQRDDPRDRRRGRALGPHHQPLGCDRRRTGDGSRRRGRPRRPGALPVPPDGAVGARDRNPMACSSPRPSGARARGCSTSTASGSPTSWPRATP